MATLGYERLDKTLDLGGMGELYIYDLGSREALVKDLGSLELTRPNGGETVDMDTPGNCTWYTRCFDRDTVTCWFTQDYFIETVGYAAAFSNVTDDGTNAIGGAMATQYGTTTTAWLFKTNDNSIRAVSEHEFTLQA